MGDWEDIFGNSESDHEAFYDMLDASHAAERRNEARKAREEFVPRKGVKVFECRFCGAQNMQWTEVYPDSWKPFDLENGCIHACNASQHEYLTKDCVLAGLQDMGFEVHVPRTSSWKHAFTASNRTQTLYLLIGKRSMDFKFYESGRELVLDSVGKLYTDGGMLVRNYYKNSDVNIHGHILNLAALFVSNTPIDQRYLSGQGSS